MLKIAGIGRKSAIFGLLCAIFGYFVRKKLVFDAEVPKVLFPEQEAFL